MQGQPSTTDPYGTSNQQIPLLRDIRFLKIVGQIIFVTVLAIGVALLVNNILTALAAQNLSPNFEFLQNRAGFAVANAEGFYEPDDSFFRAFQAGLLNTLRVITVGLVMATVIGIFVGIFLLSSNFLVRTIARSYVELLRNTPLLVQLYVWFFVIVASWPRVQNPLEFPRGNPLLVVTNRAVYLADFVLTPRASVWLTAVLIGVVLAIVMWIILGRRMELSGAKPPRGLYALVIIAAFAIVGAVASPILAPTPETITLEQDDGPVTLTLEEAREEGLLTDRDEAYYGDNPLTVIPPERRGLRFQAGAELPGTYVALLLGLVIYTSAFIAEIVRAGIQAVDKGQVEAARAVGLPYPKVLRLIILPQALRIIIPPMGNQYLNLAKNSSLAIAISYTDVFQVSNTIINQSGQTVPMFILIMATYLTISLTISFVMNQVNARFQLVTR